MYCQSYFSSIGSRFLLFAGILFLAFSTPVPGVAAEFLDGQVRSAALDQKTMCGISRSRKCDLADAIDLGLFETGLRPQFPDGLDCRDIDEQWAIDYSGKRARQNFHGGIDMPAPYDTPIIAAADGTVVFVSEGEGSFRGRELILRHSPAETGHPYWIYTQYAHFNREMTQTLGQRIKMGEVLGPTGNSGRSKESEQQSLKRRPAIHFAVWFSESPSFVNHKNRLIVPVGGLWMDPNALYRKGPPFDSAALKALPEADKKVLIPVMLEDGTTIPADTKLIWPYSCKRL
jgi:murein DD-endopeptidase MepM/ murein hydrolase activator NlpD